MSDKMERWDFTDNENGCDAMVLSEDGEFVEYEVAIRRIRELETEVKRFRERERHFADALSVADGGQYRNDWDAAIRRVLKDRDDAYARGARDGVDRIRLLLGEILDGSTN